MMTDHLLPDELKMLERFEAATKEPPHVAARNIFCSHCATDLLEVLNRLNAGRAQFAAEQKLRCDIAGLRQKVEKVAENAVDELAVLWEAMGQLRDNVLHDPDHDNDTINWALDLIDGAMIP